MASLLGGIGLLACATIWGFADARAEIQRTTDSNHELPVAENLLNQDFAPKGPNEIWTTAKTYIPPPGLSVPCQTDLFTCDIVGYAMADDARTRS
jgi:transposase InsO family protein